MRSKQSDKMHEMTQKSRANLFINRKKRKKKKSEDDSIASSDCDSDLQLPSSKRAKSIETNELNIPHEPNETNSQYEEFADFNETIEHVLIKFKETISQVKPPEPIIKKKEKPPPFNYVVVNNVSNKFSKPAIDSIYDDGDDGDDANDDNDADDDYESVVYDHDHDYDEVEYQYDDYYDGVGEVRSKHRATSTDNIVYNSISTGTIPLATAATPSSSTSRTLYEETPAQKISKIAVPAQFVAGRRRWNRRSVAPKGFNSSTSIASSALEAVNDNEIPQGGKCQDCNSNEPRRSDRKRKHTEKFLSFTEDNNRVKSASYSKDNNRVPSSTAKVSTNNDNASINSSDGEVDADIIKLFDIASSQNQYSESPRSNRLFVSTEKYSSYVEENRLPKSSRSSYLDQQASYVRNSRKQRKEQLQVEEISTNHRRRVKIKGLFTTLEGVWNKECPHCGYMHLDCATPHMLSNCCFNGKLSPCDNDADEMYSRYAYLKPLSKQITDAIMENIDNIGRLSASYNSVLGICRIGCENGNRETGARNTHEGGFEIRYGDHAFAISGRLYHCMAKQVSNTDPSCKLLP